MAQMYIALNAHLLASRAGYRTAGIHRYIHGLLTHLAPHVADAWRLTALVGARNDETYPRLAVQRASFDTEPPLRRIVWEQLVQPFALVRGGYDLYHALAFVAPLALPAVPLVVTIYDLSFVHYPHVLSPTRRLYLQALTRLTCQRARRVIAISHSTARDVAETFGIAPERIDVAAPGCDFARFRPLPHADIAAFRAAKGLPERFWLFVGTLEPRKNLVTLLRAYAALDRSERLPLVIGGGKGWQYDDIFETVTQARLESFVQFAGFIPADELALWYNSAEVFVYPSVYEGFGLPVLEAMACGTPILTSNVSSLPEVAGDASVCLPPTDVEAWREALRGAHDPAWRDAARVRGMTQAARFTWDETARATAASYGAALA